MLNVLLVGLGGFLGSVLRYLITLTPLNSSSLKIWLCNIIGSFLIGIFIELFKYNSTSHLFLSVGVLGAFTTFSTFSIGIVKIFENHRYFIGTTYIIATVFGCVLASILGIIIGKRI